MTEVNQSGTYFQYKFDFESFETNYTPELLTQSVRIGYEELTLPPNVTLNPSPIEAKLFVGETLNFFVKKKREKINTVGLIYDKQLQ